jgi:hypothetical protein
MPANGRWDLIRRLKVNVLEKYSLFTLRVTEGIQMQLVGKIQSCIMLPQMARRETAVL